MLDCYRTGGANSPETFVTAIAATLARYPDAVIYSVTNPFTGLPVQIAWMPSIKEVHDACEKAMAPIIARAEQERRIAAQIEQRRVEDEARNRKPTYDDLIAKHGKNFGLGAAEEDARAATTPAPTAEQLRHHYAHYKLGFQPKHEDLS